MDRESLKPLVEAQLGESRLTVLSEETINAELDDALTGITDDAQVDDAYVTRIAERLKRMNGNVAKEAGVQITEYKKRNPRVEKPKEETKPTLVDDEKAELLQLRTEISDMKKRLEERDAKAANDAVLADVRSRFTSNLKEGGLSVREYFVDQVFSKYELPALEKGKTYDIDELTKDVESRYYKELKLAGVKFDRPHKGGSGSGSGGADATALARREAFKEQMRNKGKLPKKSE